MSGTRRETDSFGEIDVPADRLWGAQTQRSLQHFSLGVELVPRELVPAMALVKKAAAHANAGEGRLDRRLAELVAAACDEIVAGKHDQEFPLRVWMTGSGTQFNMNVNEVIANRCSALAGEPLGSKRPVHPNDHVNMGQSTNDAFPTAMHVAAAIAVTSSLVPAVRALARAFEKKAAAFAGIVKVGRTHLQDATPITLGQELSGYVAMLDADAARLEGALPAVYELAIGGTAVGTGINASPGFGAAVAAGIASMTGLPFVSAPNKFAAQGAHDALVQLSGALKTLAVSLSKIAGDIRFLATGPRAGIGELRLPENEPGSSIMPGKVNPTQCEALTMIAAQVVGNDVAVTLGGAGGHLEMNAYKPLIAHNVLGSVRLLADGATSFRRFLVEGMEADEKRIAEHLSRSLMVVTALTPVIGYDAAARVVHKAAHEDTTPREAALALGVISAEDYDRIVDPAKMTAPYVARRGS
jgi:fumarate hydratase class II